MPPRLGPACALSAPAENIPLPVKKAVTPIIKETIAVATMADGERNPMGAFLMLAPNNTNKPIKYVTACCLSIWKVNRLLF